MRSTICIDLDPNDASSQEALGDALEQMKDYRGALEAWLRAAESAEDGDVAATIRGASTGEFDEVVREIAKKKVQRHRGTRIVQGPIHRPIPI